MSMFDLIIIGSGPAAISSLMAFKKRTISLGVINGIKLNSKIKNLDHSKIEFLNDEKKNFSDFFSNKKNNLNIYSTNNIGGLANYWGQGFGFNQYKKIKLDKKFIISQKEYLKTINYFYNFFNLNLLNKKFFINKNDYIQPSMILRGFKKYQNKELKTFEYLYFHLKKKIKFKEYNNKVLKLNNHNKYIEIILDNKKKIKSKKIIIAAGVIGNSKIIMNSFEDVKKCEFYDDCPWLIYSISLNFKLNNFLKKTLSSTFKSKNYFMTLYPMSSLNLDFIIYYFLKIKIFFLSKFKLKLLNFIIFGQIWNKNTKQKITLLRNGQYKTLDKNLDYLTKERNFLKKNKIIPIKFSKTKAGKGYHYHGLKIIDSKSTSISNFLYKKFKNKCLCIDGSIYKKIEPGPHTATEMAIAYNITKRIKFSV